MSQELEMILRKSLNEVDRSRKLQIAGFAFSFLFFLLCLISVRLTLGRVHNVATPDLLRVTLVADVELMTFTVAFCTFGICFFISRMTKKILKAIELLSKP